MTGLHRDDLPGLAVVGKGGRTGHASRLAGLQHRKMLVSSPSVCLLINLASAVSFRFVTSNTAGNLSGNAPAHIQLLTEPQYSKSCMGSLYAWLWLFSSLHQHWCLDNADRGLPAVGILSAMSALQMFSNPFEVAMQRADRA